MNEALDKLKEALEKNELDKYLKGDDHYAVKPAHFVPADIPTDWTILISKGIYVYYSENSNSGIEYKLEETMINMILDVNGLYSVTNILFYLLMREEENRAPFKINRDRIIPIVRNQLLEKKEVLTKDFRWMGKGKKEGLWSDILRLCNNLYEDYGVKIL